LEGHRVVAEPFDVFGEVRVAFVEVDGAPVEFVESYKEGLAIEMKPSLTQALRATSSPKRNGQPVGLTASGVRGRRRVLPRPLVSLPITMIGPVVLALLVPPASLVLAHTRPADVLAVGRDVEVVAALQVAATTTLLSEGSGHWPGPVYFVKPLY
jgi:hypothetical protein